MEKLTAKLSESILDKLSMDFLRNQVLKNAYGNDDTVIAGLDPRILLAWYLFFGLDPDRLSNGLLWYGCPERLSFSISYSYRMLPMLMEEFQNVLLSYRLRGNPPAHDTLMGKVRYLIYQVKVIMHAFYPLMLNTAKRSRTTVEALELRGYRYAASSKAVKKIKLASLKVTYNDLLFLAVSFLWMTAALLASTLLS